VVLCHLLRLASLLHRVVGAFNGAAVFSLAVMSNKYRLSERYSALSFAYVGPVE